ncbi:MAG: response regulator transcription factor [Chloroflexi bacterium]|nr:response regulator transcription factor [Chloroflexota bacterium]
MAENKIRVLVVDDHPIEGNGTRALLNKIDDIEVVGAAKNGSDVLVLNKDLNPDVLLVHLIMSEMDEFEVIRRLTAEQPEVKILVLTSFLVDGKGLPPVKSGVLGYLLKDSEPEDLEKAIRQVYYGKPLKNHSIDRKKPRSPDRSSAEKPIAEALTKREHEVLHLLAKGKDNRQIAERLVISEVTVRTHVSRIMSKLQLTNRVQAVLYALREGLVGLDDGEEDPG